MASKKTKPLAKATRGQAKKACSAKGETAPKVEPKRRYDPQRILDLLPGHTLPEAPRDWIDFPEGERDSIVDHIRDFVKFRLKELKYKPPTGSEYALLMLLLYSAKIADTTARKLFAKKKVIVRRARQCRTKEIARRSLEIRKLQELGLYPKLDDRRVQNYLAW
jgi:hypothetical protein